MTKLNTYVIIFTLLFTFNELLLSSEIDTTHTHAFDGDIHLKNMHLWRGSVVTPGALFASSIEYTTPDQKLKLGLWGGAGFTGEYKEFSYYASYKIRPNLYAEVVSHNNYSGIESPDIFSYDKHNSPNFVDIAVGYTISERLPLSIYWATILAGQAQDYEVEQNGSITDSYSNYVELKYKAWEDDKNSLSVFLGGAFSFTTEKTFYSEQANLVNMGLNLEKRATLFNHEIPLNFSAIWNPEKKIGVLEIDIALF